MLRHIVSEGQTVDALAKSYGVTVEELLNLNGLHAVEMLHAGLVIYLPGGEEAEEHHHEHHHDHHEDHHHDHHHHHADEHRPRAVLRLPEPLFFSLKELEEDDGYVELRILRVREGEAVVLEIT